jgi:transposase
MHKKVSSEKFVQDIRRKTRKKYSSEEKIRIVLEGLRGEDIVKAFLPTCITAGAKISWKRARNASWEIRLVRPTLEKSPILKRKTSI